jgi:hypothetical protein
MVMIVGYCSFECIIHFRGNESSVFVCTLLLLCGSCFDLREIEKEIISSFVM